MKYLVLTAFLIVFTLAGKAQVKVSKPAGLDGVLA